MGTPHQETNQEPPWLAPGIPQFYDGLIQTQKYRRTDRSPGTWSWNAAWQTLDPDS